MKSRLYNVTKYFGFLAVLSSWSCLIGLSLIHHTNWSEPISQFGYYADTKRFFAGALIFAAIVWYLFSLHLNIYWRWSSLCTFFAGIFFIIVGLIPYQPGEQTFIIDGHNIAILCSAVLYIMPMAFIGYKKSHQNVARLSKILFYITLCLLILSVSARAFNTAIIYAQTLALLPVQIWLIAINLLILEQHKIAITKKDQLL